MSASRIEILRLYKNLLLYSKSLRLTDTKYYKERVSSEFKKNKILKSPKDITYAVKKGEALLRRGTVV